MAKTSCKKGQYYCNTDKKCKPIPKGYTVREDGFLVKEGWSAKYKKSIDCNNPKGFSQKAHCAGKEKKMTEESNPRIARKKGQPAKSKKHSDLYTDEDPKGTIHGLGFKDVATAKASVAKIRKSGRSHAHKIQAAIAMEQRARVMGKTSEAAVYRKFIDSMKKKTKKMNEEKHGDHEPEMIRSQLKTAGRASKRIEKHSRRKDNFKAWVQSKITKASDYLDTAADYLDSKDVKEASSPTTQDGVSSYLFNKLYLDTDKKKKDKKPKSMSEGSLHKWFKGSKSKDGKGGWVNVKTGGTCASDEPGEGVPKCVSRSKYDSMSKKERESAHRRKRDADPNQQSKTGAAKPTYVSTDKPKKKKKKTMKDETEFTSLPLVLEVPQNDGEFKLGLMFRESLEQDRGMLFIFEDNDYHTFHMKNTFIPLDIAFIKEDGTIDSIEELDPMNPIPVCPESEIRYAVEVNRGWFAENDVNVGDALLEEEDLTEGKDKKGKGSGTKDACYYKVKSRYSVWPSAYASGALVKCRKVGAANWGNSKKEEVEYEYEVPTNSHYSWRDSLNEGEGRMKGYSTYGKEWSNESPMKLAKKSYESGGTGQTLTIGGRTRVITKKEADDHKKKVMSTKATKYNTYARNTPYSRSMGFDHYVPTGDEINEEKAPRSVTDKDFLKKVRQGGIEYEITKNMSDREHKKHLKKTGNLKDLKKEPYSYKHHSDEKYQDAVKAYDDRINKSVEAHKTKDKAMSDRIEKEGKKRRGENFTLKQVVPTMKRVVKKEHYSWRDSFDLEEMTIAQRNSMQNRNKMAARSRAQEMARQRIGSGTAKNPDTTIAQSQAANKASMQANARARNVDFKAERRPAAKPMASNPQGMRQQGVGKSANDLSRHSTGSSAAAPKKQGLLGRIGSGIKRVAGGVADAATGNRFDFDKRGGQRPARPAGQAAGGAVAARGGNVRGSGARNRPMQRPAQQGNTAPARQAAGGAQDALNRNPNKPRVGQDALNRNPNRERIGTPAVGQRPQGSTATLTGSAGSLQKNRQKANRIANAANRAGGNVSVGKITGGQGVADF